MQPAHCVTYVAEDGDRYALVIKDHDDGTLDLLVADHNGAWGVHEKVPHGQPGEGVTWH